MPGPPPPPPMAPPPMMPPPPTMSLKSSKNSSDDRSALLKSIRTGAKLKKTVTNDKSAPMIPGKVSNVNSSNSTTPSGGPSNNHSPTPNGLNLGGLFVGGMPKLRATGKLGASSLNNLNSNNNINNINYNDSNNMRKKPEAPPQPFRNLSSVQNELKKQMASDNKNRGPPPPAPIRNLSDETSTNLKQTISRNGMTSSNGFHSNQNTLHTPNNSTLHRKAKSNANLTTLDNSTDSINNFNNQNNKPVINHGKPNLAPKPPSLINGSKPMTPPKKLIINGKPVSRAHSMRSPRSPSPQSPDNNNAAVKFGTVRNLSSVIGQSLANSTGNLSPRQRPALNGRPSAPPPSIPSTQQLTNLQNVFNNHSQLLQSTTTTPPPPSKTNIVRPPNHAPPPPPPSLSSSSLSSSIPQPPNHAPPQPPNHAPPPPPPPHRTQPMRAPPAVPGGNLNAPPPPPRHSSMREVNMTRKNLMDLDEKFKHMFHSQNMFPKPPPFKQVLKLYPNRGAGSKQQAPQPPQLQASNKSWNTTSAC